MLEAILGDLQRKQRLLTWTNFHLFARLASYPDGDYIPASSGTLTKWWYFWRDVTINSGITITVASPGLVAFARNISVSGLLTASGKGAAGGAAVTVGDSTTRPGNPGNNGDGGIGGGGEVEEEKRIQQAVETAEMEGFPEARGAKQGQEVPDKVLLWKW